MKLIIHRIGAQFLISVLAVSFVYSQGFDRDAAERKRDAVTQQPRLLDIGGVVAGMMVGEVGAGAGYLAFHLAARVGPTGKVYANDILEQALEVIRSRAAKKGLTNIEAVLGAKDDPQFPTRGLDRVFFLESFHEIRPPDGFLARLASYLKPTARVVIYELESEKPMLLDGEHRYLRREFLDIVARSPFKIDLIDTNFPGPNPEDHHPVAYVLSLKDRPDPAAKYDYDAIDRRRSARFQEYRLLDISEVDPGMIVADIGAGEGYLTFHLAARVGPAGKVYANEILESALDVVRSRATKICPVVQGRDVPVAAGGVVHCDLFVHSSWPRRQTAWSSRWPTRNPGADDSETRSLRMMRKTCFPATAILSLAVPVLAAGPQTVIENFENEVFAIRDVNIRAPARGTNTLSARISNRTGTERILAIDIRTECIGFGMTNQQRPVFFRLQPKESRDIRIGYQIATPLLGRIILRAGESDAYVDIDDWQALPESAQSKIPLPDPRYVWRQVVYPKPGPGPEAAVRDLVSAHDIDLQGVEPESLARLKAALPGRLEKARNEDNALRTRLSKLFRLDRDSPREFDFQDEGWGDRSAYMSRIFENYGVRVEAFSISGERGGRISSFFATRKGSGAVKKPLILLLSGNPPGTKESLIGAAVFFSLLGYHAVGIDRRPEARTLDTKEKFLKNWADPVFDAHRTIDFLVSQDRYAVSNIGIYGLSAGAGEAKFLAALDGRVKAAVLACGVASFNTLFRNEGWVPTLSGMIIYPELGLGSPEIGRLTSRQFQENLDKLKPEHHLQARRIFNDLFPFFEDLDPLRVVPLLAPMPLLIVSGTEDEQFTIPGVVEVDSVAAEEYRKYGMLSGFEFYPEPRAGHWVNEKAGYIIGAFFKRWLD